MTTGKQELAVADKQTALATLPEHLRDQVGNRAGKENVGREDMLIPRLCISQSQSPQLNKKMEEYIPDLKVGEFFNSVTGEVYGPKVTVVPLHFFKQYIEFNPRPAGGGLGGIKKMYPLGSTPPLADLQFTEDDKGNSLQPKATEFKNRMSLLLKDGKVEPIVVSFKSTGLKTAKKWNFLIAEKNLPAYAYTYNLEVVDQAKGQLSWKGAEITRGEFVPAALFQAAEEFFQSLQGEGVQIDTTGLETEAAPTTEDTSF